MIVEVDSAVLALRERLTLGAATLVPKAEHHVTVFSYGVGRPLRWLCDAVPDLQDRIHELQAEVPWEISGSGRFYHVLEGTQRQTVIESVDAPDVVGAVPALRELIREQLHARPELENTFQARVLLALLVAPPEPHITLYTDDPAGLGAIGIKSKTEFDAALHGTERDSRGVRAYPLNDDVVAGTFRLQP